MSQSSDIIISPAAASSDALLQRLLEINPNDSDLETLKYFRAPSNPYGLYNNADRLLNIFYRYQTLGNLKSALETYSRGWPDSKVFVQQGVFRYEKLTNVLTQYQWATSALSGIGNSINNRGFGDSTKRQAAEVALARQIINAFMEATLLAANAARWSSDMNPYQVDMADPFKKNAIKMNQDAIKTGRGTLGAIASFGFVANGIIGLGMNAKALSDAVNAGNDTDIKIQTLQLTSAIASISANVLKGLNSVGSLKGWSSNVNNGLGFAGSFLGLLNGALNIASLAPMLEKPLTDEQKGVIGAEMAFQTVGGIGLAVSNIMLAANMGKMVGSGASIAGPALGALASAIMVMMSPLEIYGMVQQSRYADQLKELGKEMLQYGYAGDNMLADLYREKTAAEGALFAVTTAINLGGTAASIALAATGIGAPIAALVGLITGALSAILKGVQQPIIESIARRYAEKIKESGGGFEFFAKNLAAKYARMTGSEATVAYLNDLQAAYGVDSVVGISSIQISSTARELAAITYNAAEYLSATAFIDRFVNGKAQPDKNLKVDLKGGVIDLGGGTSGQTQFLTFLTPLLAPGEEKKQRVSTGKNEYTTTVSLIMKSTDWSIHDGGKSSTMDLRKIVSEFKGTVDLSGKTARDSAKEIQIGLKVDAGAGNDTIIANTSTLDVEGGEGFDTVSYRGIQGDVSLEVTPTENGFLVKKTLKNYLNYVENVTEEINTHGKRSEKVQYRDFEVVVNGNEATRYDVLRNVEAIYGGSGDDKITGSDGDNVISGGLGRDEIHAGKGNDLLLQDLENVTDTLDGGEGLDTVDYGGASVDKVVFEQTFESQMGWTSDYKKMGSAPKPGDSSLVSKVPSGWDFSVVDENVRPAGEFLLVDGSTDKTQDFWRQKANLKAGQQYVLTFDVVTSMTSRPIFQLYIGGTAVGARFETYGMPDTGMGFDWGKRVSIAFTAKRDGAQSLSLRDLVTSASGNDFAVDNIVLARSDPGHAGVSIDLQAGRVDKLFSGGFDTLVSIENAAGSQLDDVIIGTQDGNVLAGNAGDDRIEGRGGNDVITGGAGSDRLSGDDGDDVFFQELEKSDDYLNGGEGNDTVDYSHTGADALISQDFSNNASWSSDYRTAKKNVDGSVKEENGPGSVRMLTTLPSDWGFKTTKGASGGADNIFAMVDGSADSGQAFWKQQVTLASGGKYQLSFDAISGGGTAPRLQAYVSGNAVGSVTQLKRDNGWTRITIQFDSPAGGAQMVSLKDIETANGNNDFAIDNLSLVRLSGANINLSTGKTDKLGDGADTLVSIENVVGTGLADEITGDANNNILAGGRGNDVLYGGAGSDVLRGDEGDDVLYGEEGNDVLAGLTGNDKVYGGKGDDLILQNLDAEADSFDGGDGVDTVDYSLTKAGAVFYQTFDNKNGWSTDYRKLDGVAGAGSVALTKVLPSGWGFTTDKGVGGTTDNPFLMVDGATDSTKAVWKQDVSLVLGSTYRLSFDVIGGEGAAPRLQAYRMKNNTSTSFASGAGVATVSTTVNEFDGAPVMLKKNDGWTHVEIVFQATMDGMQTVALRDLETAAGNNDFGLDNIALSVMSGVDVNLASGTTGKLASGGSDTLRNIENAVGTDLDDTLTGDVNDNSLSGGSGHDVLRGNEGDDYLDGGDGDDQLYGGAGHDTLLGGSGVDYVSGGDGNDMIRQNLAKENDTLDGGAGNDTLDYSTTKLTPLLFQSFTLSDGWSTDYGSKALLSSLPNWGFATTNGATGSTSDTFLLVDGSGDTSKAFWKQQVTLVKGSKYQLSFDVIGNDGPSARLQAYLGDALAGSAVTLKKADGWSRVTISFEAGADGVQMLSLKDMETAAINNDFGIDNIALQVSSGVKVNLESGTGIKLAIGGSDTLSGIENVVGTNLDDDITGDARDNQLLGGEGADRISGGAGNDVILQNLAAENDVLDGGDGIDTVDYSLSKLEPLLVQGFDSKAGVSTDYVLGDILNGAGSGALVSTLPNWGFATTNGATGNTGDAFLLVDGGGDASKAFWKQQVTLVKGSKYQLSFDVIGNDGPAARLQAYLGDALAGSAVTLKKADGWSRVTISFEAGADGAQLLSLKNLETATEKNDFGIDNLALQVSSGVKVNLESGTGIKLATGGSDTLSGIENVVGTNLDDDITGTVGDNFLAGGDGNDILDGKAGNDALYGNNGNDILHGGDGDDTLAGGAGADRIEGGGGNDVIAQDMEAVNDILDGGDGTDTIDYSISKPGLLLVQGFDSKVGVRTDYALGDTINGAGSEALVSTLPNWGFATTNGATGNTGDTFLLVDGGGDASKAFWKQQVTLVKGSKYQLSFDVIGNDGPAARLQAYLGDALAGSAVTLKKADGWSRVTISFEAGVHGAQLLSLKNLETATEKNDFGIDNLALQVSSGVKVNLESGTGIKLATGGSDTLSGIENVVGSDLDDDITGDAKDNLLTGGEGADRIRGGAGNDVILQNLAAENDVLDGGEGIDTLDYSVSKPGLLLVQGFDSKVGVRTDYALGDAINGAGSEALVSTLPNWGFATTNGVTGNTSDTFLLVDGGGDASKAFWKQQVTLVKGRKYQLSFDVIGNDGPAARLQAYLGDALAGSAVTLKKADGWSRVTISFEAGADGAQLLSLKNLETATAKNDLGIDNIALQVSSGVKVNLESGTGIKMATGGSDTLSGIENVVGSDLDDDITGDAKDNLLVGGAGTDRIAGGAGNDVIVQNLGPENDVLDGGAGTDTVDYSLSTVGNLLMQTFGGKAGIGTDYALGDTINGAGSEALVSTLPNWGFATTNGATGNTSDTFLLVDGGGDASKAFWKQQVTLVKGRKYQLSFDVIGNDGPAARLQAYLGDALAGSAVTLKKADGWSRVTISFEAVADGAQLLSLKNLETATEKNDVGIDNLALATISGIKLDLAAGKAIKLATGGTDTLSGIENVVGTVLDDDIAGDAGANVLIGGRGNDVLAGGAGDDIYLFGRGDGVDTIIDTGGTQDKLQFGDQILSNQLWFAQSSNDLTISVIGTQDSVTVKNWYRAGDGPSIESFETADGHRLVSSNVASLVQAMATFSPPAMGETQFQSDKYKSLETVLASNWH